MENLSSTSRWKYFNIDRAEEILETKNKAIILLAGASSSGKSYCAKMLEQAFFENGHKSITISTDNYNKGISGIICDKVNQKYFDGKLKNIEEIKKIVKKCIYNTDFSQKFCKNDLENVKKGILPLIDKDQIKLFLQCLKSEFDIINFDEPTVYDLSLVAKDVNTLFNNGTIIEKKYSKSISEQLPNQVEISGKDYDVIIIEGIYVLEDELINKLDPNIVVKNFIESDAKSLFLRRVIRDSKIANCDNCFTIGIYFKYIIPSYINQILPNKSKADCVFKNDMTFSELHTGDVFVTKQKFLITNPKLLKSIMDTGKIVSVEKQKDIYFCSKDNGFSEDNLLRLRTIWDENTNTYVPTSLVHKGAIKSRKDKKITRPINILIKEGDFFKVFESEQDFLNQMKSAGFDIDYVAEKKRTRLILNNHEITIDDIKGSGVYIEFAEDFDKKIINNLLSHNNISLNTQKEKQE